MVNVKVLTDTLEVIILIPIQDFSIQRLPAGYLHYHCTNVPLKVILPLLNSVQNINIKF